MISLTDKAKKAIEASGLDRYLATYGPPELEQYMDGFTENTYIHQINEVAEVVANRIMHKGEDIQANTKLNHIEEWFYVSEDSLGMGYVRSQVATLWLRDYMMRELGITYLGKGRVRRELRYR